MFFGEKLQKVRELNGLSRKELAETIGISEQAIWQYENQYTVPKFEVINQFKKIFKVKPQFFFEAPFVEQISSTDDIAYRSDDRDARKKVKMETSYIDFVDYFIEQFETQLDVEQGDIESLTNQIEQLYYGSDQKTGETIAEIARIARTNLNVDQNKALLYQLEIAGVFVLEKNMGPTIDAYSTWTQNQRPFIILGSKKKSAVRRNFDLAHELGHLLMHRKIDMDSLTTFEYKAYEKEANYFASVFLLPEQEFIKDFEKINKKSNPFSYVELKMKYSVSIIALEYRAYQLNLLSFEENRYFYASLNRNGFRTEEPLDADIPIVKPGKVRALISFIFENKLLKMNDFLDQYQIEAEFLATLLAIETTFIAQFEQLNTKEYYFSK
ncbi:helix-turn-helix domain-containing protein [Latilactobacillus fuchuensis]|uniref:spr1629 family repressor/antitoxin n=1 Tax=Latilactobacillus fuchuensis TaxID=164393 RepID=UPI0020C7A01B|nr:XRE family transcriptional regulator [Latilactobacillus fuchuensis]MCP8856784.1 XRE family transcriptional regulator [Latilactobacillus fuchuensis]